MENDFNFVVILSTLIYCMKIIYQLCFFGFRGNYDEDKYDKLLDIIILILNTFYIISNFFHSYLDKETGEEVTDPKKNSKTLFKRMVFY